MFRKTTTEGLAARMASRAASAEGAFISGRFDRGMRLAASAEDAREELENLTGIPWELWGSPRQD